MKLDQVIQDAVESLGLSLWDKEFLGSSRRLVVYIDSSSGGVTVDHCTQVAMQLKAVLRTEQAYSNLLIDISSPGINRHLIRPEHYEWAIGKCLKVVLRQDEAGYHQRRGVLTEVTPRGIVMDNDEGRQEINFANIKKTTVEDIMR